jgi:hypothetical protein
MPIFVYRQKKESIFQLSLLFIFLQQPPLALDPNVDRLAAPSHAISPA